MGNRTTRSRQIIVCLRPQTYSELERLASETDTTLTDTIKHLAGLGSQAHTLKSRLFEYVGQQISANRAKTVPLESPVLLEKIAENLAGYTAVVYGEEPSPAPFGPRDMAESVIKHSKFLTIRLTTDSYLRLRRIGKEFGTEHISTTLRTLVELGMNPPRLTAVLDKAILYWKGQGLSEAQVVKRVVNTVETAYYQISSVPKQENSGLSDAVLARIGYVAAPKGRTK